MDYNNIKRLLDKYWAGETSLAEEQLLKDYFNGNHVAPDLEQYKVLFVYFGKAAQKQSEQTFEGLKKEGTTIRRLIPPKWVAAASVVLIAAASFLDYSNLQGDAIETDVVVNEKLLAEDTYKDPEEAYKEAKAALMLISKGLNKGIQKTKEGVRKVQK